MFQVTCHEEIHRETERGAAMKVEEYKKVIAMAVENEIEAYDFYTAVGEKVKDANLKSIFKDLADEEKKHRNFLQGLLSQAKPMRFDESKDYKISESIDKPKLSIGMKPADAIALAMKNEEEAMNMYTELANSSADKEQKEMFESLARMEKGHKVRLEGMYTNMAFPEVW
jgi:rubrerythrin